MIEKKIHQIWLQGSGAIPKEEGRLVSKWKDLAKRSGYQHRLWSEEEYLPLVRKNNLEGEYRSRINLTQKSDIARWAILKEHGGVHIDVDIEPSPLLNKIPTWNVEILLMRMPIGIFSFLTVGVSFIGIQKGSDLPDAMLKKMKIRINQQSGTEQGRWSQISSTTGSRLLKNVLDSSAYKVTWIDTPHLTYDYGDGYYLSTHPSSTEYFTVHQTLGKDSCNSMCYGARVWSVWPGWEVWVLLALCVVIVYLILRR